MALVFGVVTTGCAKSGPKQVEVETIRRVQIEPNPTGLQLGFWTNYDWSNAALADFGLRPLERVDFTKWENVERVRGEYTKPDWRSLKDAQLCGSTMIVSVNTIFTREVQPASASAIPAFYPQRITDPVTRAAAKKFLRTYVGWLMDDFGSFWLSLDYEFFWFYLPNTLAIQEEYRDWYVEAAALVREEAARRGLADRIKLIPIVNADMKSAQKFLGSPAENHQPAAWMQDIVAVSDGLALDVYAADEQNPASGEPAFANIRFWLEAYGAPGKPFFVTENGFSSVREQVPDYPAGYHARGTEAQQASFFEDVLERIRTYNAGVRTGKRIDGYCVWMYTDFKNPSGTKEALEDHFGLLRLDGSRKPAFDTVRSFFKKSETDPVTSPWRRGNDEDVKAAWARGEPMAVTYVSGTEHGLLELTCQVPVDTQRLRIDAELAEPGGIVAELNGEVWRGIERKDVGRTLSLVMDVGIRAGEKNTLRLRFTGQRYPLAQQVMSLKVTGE